LGCCGATCGGSGVGVTLRPPDGQQLPQGTYDVILTSAQGTFSFTCTVDGTSGVCDEDPPNPSYAALGRVDGTAQISLGVPGTPPSIQVEVQRDGTLILSQQVALRYIETRMCEVACRNASVAIVLE
jgi:hypothetical protein